MTTDRHDWYTADLDDLCRVMLTLDAPADLAHFLRDLCTHHELQELTTRWAIVRLLQHGLPYREIARRTGASTATITRVNQWLQRGTGGYQAALEKSTDQETAYD